MDEKRANIRVICKQLGAEYRVCNIDFEPCIFRDFGNGFNVEVSGITNKSKNRKVNLYLWFGTEPNDCIMVKGTFRIDCTPEAIHAAAERLYDDSRFLRSLGLNSRQRLFRLKQHLYENGKEDSIMKLYYGSKPAFTENDKKLFSHGNYECKELFKTHAGNPVVISQSKHKNFPVWKVEHGYSCVVFNTYDEALAYCKGRFCILDGRTV